MWLTKRIVYLCVILLAIIIASRKHKIFTPSLKWLKILIDITFIVELAAVILAYTIKKNSFLYMGFSFIQVVLITLIYLDILESIDQKKIILILAVVCIVSLIVTSIINKAWSDVNSEGNAIKSLFIIALCLLTFTYWLKYPDSENILKEPMFWMNSGFFFFFSINIFFWIGYNFFEKQNIGILKKLEPIHYTSNLLLYLSISVSFILFKVPVPNQCIDEKESI